MLSVVCPVWNEEKVLHANAKEWGELAAVAELIFVDGGSSDGSQDIAAAFGKVLQSAKGRALQMNQGAKAAHHDILLFLHADTVVKAAALGSIEKAVRERRCVGGCLTQRIDAAGAVYRVIETQGNLRARMSKVFYGDQGIFARQDVFSRIGGFPEVPVFEDVLFARKLRRAGMTAVLSDKILVSPRRWQKRGVLRTSLMFHILLIGFKLGVPLERLTMCYEDLR